MKRRVGVLLAGLPLVALAWSLRSDAPEPADWRVYLREPELSFVGGWFEFAGRPNHLGFATLYRALLSLGVDIATLVGVGWALAALCVGAVWRLAPRAILAWPLLALLAFSPAFGANWLLVERLRVFLPAACACAMVLLLRAPLHRARFVVATGLAVLAVLTHETGSLLWVAMLPLMVCPERRSSEVRRCCVELAGASPVAVSAEAPRSRLQSPREIASAKRSVKSLRRGVCLGRGEQSRRPNPKG